MSTMLLVEGSSKTGFFRHLSNHVSEANNFGNFFFSKRSKFEINFKNPAKKGEKKFFVSQIIASELLSLNCLYEEQDTFHRHSKS